jgi:hypothetical protein
MAHSEVIETQFVLVSARKSRGGDYWDNDDYDVRFGGNGRVVGRIFRQPPGTEGAAVVLDDNRARSNRPRSIIAATLIS